MAQFTIVATIRKRQRIYQVKADSAANAIRTWADSLDIAALSDFGRLSKQRLVDALRQFGPNRVEDMPNVYEWHAAISEFRFAVVIIQTEEA